MIEIPLSILEAIEKILSTVSQQNLNVAAANLSKGYREQSEGKKKKHYMRTLVEKKGYLALRFPATFAAIMICLQKIQYPIKTVLDIGAGPGTAALAAISSFSSINELTLLEQDAELITFSKLLLEPYKVQKNFFNQSMQMLELNRPYDLIIAAYSLSEIPSESLAALLEKLWNSTAHALLIVEPGTPYGFQLIHHAREILIGLNATILAPCTHEKRCPLFQTEDWCHFAVRLTRPAFQRRVKNADLGYEDEKYTYLIVTKDRPVRAYARIVKTPEKHSGHVNLTLCTPNGLEKKIISKKQKELYKSAKKAEWGDLWGEP